MDVINTISTTESRDSVHKIYFLRNGVMRKMTLAELDRRAAAVALRLRDLGVRRGDRIGVMAKNSIEWILLDIAILKLGAVTAGLEAGRFGARASVDRYGLKLLFVDDLPEGDRNLMAIAEVWRWVDEANDRPWRCQTDGGYKADDVCAIKFTSGSTGVPKGLEARVGSINDSLSAIQEMFCHGHGDNILVFLRLALLQQRYWIYSALVYHHDVTVSDMENVIPTAQDVGPTVIMAVPGFFDEVKARVEFTLQREAADRPDRHRAIQSLLGGRIRYLWTGSAPASRATLDFYNDCGVPLYEGYGLNETCIVAKNCPTAHRIGSVGRVLPNKTVRIDTDGTLVVGSRNPVNTRYTWSAAGENERVFMPSGEVRTNDMGYFDADNYLYILGRVDDIVTLSSGRNILVRPIEDSIKQHVDVHECVLYGTGRPYITAVISAITATVEEATIKAHIDLVNMTLLPEQQVRGIVFAKERFSMENGLLTSQFKPRRKEIFSRYSDELQAIYHKDYYYAGPAA